MWLFIYVCTRGSILNSKSNTLESDQTEHDRPASCVIAQHYSSVTFVSMRLHSGNEKLGAPFKNVIVLVCFAFLILLGSEIA
jgi:hypothetical protein